MPILDTEILWRPAALVSDAIPAQNGGRMDASRQIVSGVKNNLFPDVSQAERTAGSTRWRKAFVHVASASDVALQSVRLFLDAPTPAGDWVLFYPGTQTDTEDVIVANPAARPYGIGTLVAPVAPGDTTLPVFCEHLDHVTDTTLQPFRAGDLVRVSDAPSTGGVGNEEWVTVSAVNYGPGNQVTLTVSALANGYAVANTLVSSVYSLASVAAVADTVSVNSAGGTFDVVTPGNLTAHNQGAIEQNWTLTFSGPGSFSATGDTVGALTGPGSTTADFAPVNPATGTPYFTIKFQAWGGAFAAGDTVSFSTHPAAIPLWYRRRVPAGTASLANDFCSLAIHGESA